MSVKLVFKIALYMYITTHFPYNILKIVFAVNFKCPDRGCTNLYSLHLYASLEDIHIVAYGFSRTHKQCKLALYCHEYLFVPGSNYNIIRLYNF